MAIKKVKLPNNTVVDINDARIPGIDSSPTANSTNLVTSGGVKAALTNGSVTKVGTATVGAANRPIYLNAGTPTITSPGEAFLSWGGQNFSASYGPIDAAMVSELGACRTMFAKAAGIVIEYSRDSGTTWIDYGATDAQKVGMFSSGVTFYIGKSSTSGASSTNYMLRVTLRTSAAGIYTTLNKFVIFVGTNGSTGCYCTIRVRTQQNYEDNVDSWVTRAENIPISGWSGYNVINISGTTTYGNTKSTQYGEWQFIFGCTGYSGSASGLSVSKIFGFGGVGWTTPSTMAKTGHLYGFDSSQNATFPANVTASSFIKSGGTAAQFLKANGSVDSNTYLTTGIASSTYLTQSNAASTYLTQTDAASTYLAANAAATTYATKTELNGKQDTLTIDTALSTTSTNVVQNKAVAGEFGKVTYIGEVLEEEDESPAIKYLTEQDGTVYYPVTHEKGVMDSNGVTLPTKLAQTNAWISNLGAEVSSLDSAIQSVVRSEASIAWNGDSTPVVSKIPAGVNVVYNSTSYTGTLEASASNVGTMFLVAMGNGYNRYMSVKSGNSYVWADFGSTEMDLSDYQRKDDEIWLTEEEFNAISIKDTTKTYNVYEEVETL